MKTRKVTYPVSGTSHAFFESVFRFCLPKEYVMLGVLIYLSIAHFKSGLDGLEKYSKDRNRFRKQFSQVQSCDLCSLKVTQAYSQNNV